MGICVSCRRRERKAPEKRSAPGTGGPVKGTAAAELLPRRLERLPTMANSMSNIKMTNPIKGIVSKRRRRYQKDGFNLDLAYITDRLIAMGIPAEKLEGVYRNHIDEVFRFLEHMHKDRYQIYNLCSERSYDESKFHKRVVGKYAFDDHTPPKIENIQPFCEDVHNWLSSDPNNVAAVHCKAGKGRTGTMVCCYLLYSGQKTTADEALKYYGNKRTHDDKGVTIPSQRRYVEYFAWLLRSGLQYTPTKVQIRELVMSPPPIINGGQCSPELVIAQAKNSNFNSMPFKKPPSTEVRRTSDCVRVTLTDCTVLRGDVRVDVYHKRMKMRKEKLFHFWFNTFFVTAEMAGAVRVPSLHDSPDLETYKLTLNKWELDDAHKDKQHKHYTQDFKVELIIERVPESSTFSSGGARAPSPPSSSSSSDHDANWDSGEPPYSRLHHYDTPDTSSDTPDTRDTGLSEYYHDTLDTSLSDCHKTITDPSEYYLLTDHSKGRDTTLSDYYKSSTDSSEYYRSCSDTQSYCKDVTQSSGYQTDTRSMDDRNKDCSNRHKDRFKCCIDSQSYCKDVTQSSGYQTDTLSMENRNKDGFDRNKDGSDRHKDGFMCCSDSQSYCKDVTQSAYQCDALLIDDGNKDGLKSNKNFRESCSECHKGNSGYHEGEIRGNCLKVSQTNKECKDKPNFMKGEGRARLSLGDVRASWRGLSGKFNMDVRKKKDEP